MSLLRWALALCIFLVTRLNAEEYNINVGDTVSDGVPAPGAGRLATAQESDFYLFTATAGQLVFAESLVQDPAFQRNLRWQLIKPNGLVGFSSFFTTVPGRTVLPDAGVYKIRVFTDGSNAAWTGSYSFRLLAIPPDQTFPISIGQVISDGVPLAGAGRLEVPGAEESYTFNATAGDLVFFESLSQAVAFEQNLRWQLNRPNGTPVFASFFANPQGRTLLADSGQYTLRIFTSGNDSGWFGDYSFRTLPIAPDQVFSYTIGTLVTNGIPAVGAGKLEDPGSEDRYTFAGTAEQIVFFESINQAAAFGQNLRWQLIKPNGQTLFSSFFTNPQGRTILTDTGVYTIRVFTSGTDSKWFGEYSFRTQGIAQDQTFPYLIGNVVSDGVPAPGAGKLEDPGSVDSYTFTATAGQIVFFESISQAAAFGQNLRWQLTGPNGQNLFSSFFTNPQGRTVLAEAGEYTIRVFTSGTDPKWFGEYSFRTQGVAQDQTFPYAVGTGVSDGVPAPGAGKLEDPGAVDSYTFTATAGQIVFFESISQAPAFANNLRWQLLPPTGPAVFSSYFANSQGRTVLPVAGEYRIRLFTDGNQAEWVGIYSFSTRAIGDQEIPIRLGDVISDGQPEPGAGRIETPGSEDIYTFTGRAGDVVYFEAMNLAASFQKSLRWQLLKPSGTGQPVFSAFFDGFLSGHVLPEEGIYKIRVFTDANNPAWVGEYSFRTYARVFAGQDNASTKPDRPVSIPFAKLLFNDRPENLNDSLQVTLPNAVTAEGGTVTLGATAVLYTPKAGFSGQDRFTYRLQGNFGGTNDAPVHVAVTAIADDFATVVNWVWRDPQTVEVDLMAQPNTNYQLESGSNLETWTPIRIIAGSIADPMTFTFSIAGPSYIFFRAPRVATPSLGTSQ